MTNLTQFLNKTKTIDARCEVLANQLMQDYQKGVIKTELELFYRLKQAVKTFYSSIGKPTYKFIPARGTPISKDFNTMVLNSYNDMSVIINECENISNILESSYTDAELAREMLSNKMLYINKKLDDLKNRIVINNNSNAAVFMDSFTNKEMAELSSDISAEINTVDGVLTLKTITSNLASSGIKLEILDGSNGFPGNTHQVDILDGNFHFVGETAPHMDLNDVIDNNSDTWFEYEVYTMNDEILTSCNGYGLNYKEGISWVTNDPSLKLKLKITLESPSEYNWLSLTPFIPETRGSRTSVITKCTISDGSGQIQEINQVKVFDDNTVIMFSAQTVQFVILEIEQPIPYDVNVGHFYFTKTDNINTLIFDETRNTEYQRVDGETPSVELLNMHYDPSTKQYVQPKNYSDDPQTTFVDDAYTKSQLFIQPSDTNESKSNKEMLPAHRYCIGIRNLTLAKYSFDLKSVYISTLFKTNDPIVSISLEADELIPKEFNDTLAKDLILSSNQRDQWIKYEISIDNGTTWKPIYPKHRAFQGPCVFKINSEVPKALRSANVIYIDTFVEPMSVKLKITLTRPDVINLASKSPVVYAYRLKTLTGDDNREC